jgi:iron(III) transport system substrate-binding protein
MSVFSYRCALFFLLILVAGCAPGDRSATVAVYTSQDQVYAEPILREFTRRTGIAVRTVYDSEAVKTVGLANRLLAERRYPQCDVFWSNEEFLMRYLAAQDALRRTNGWAAFGYRLRHLVANTNRLSSAQAPQSLTDLTNAVWSGKVALAYPLFGTTAFHFLALRQHWGAARWEVWCRALVANKSFLVDGNSVVVKLVGRGEAWIGLTDSDDVWAGRREGLPVSGLPLAEGQVLIRNTAGVIRGAPHPEAAQQLFAYLQSQGVADKLIQAKALEGPSTAATSIPALAVDWDALLRDWDSGTTSLKEVFLR